MFEAPKRDSNPWTVVHGNSSDKKYITQDTLIQTIRQKQKVITTEVDLKETMQIDDSWGSFDIFKKIQSINLYGKGIYTVDLSKISTKDITITPQKNLITIKIPKPTVEMVNIDPQKTEYKTENGLLRFGEMKLTSEENNQMQKDAMDKMKAKMNEQKYFLQAENNSKSSMKKIIESTINDGKSSATVNIEIK